MTIDLTAPIHRGNRRPSRRRAGATVVPLTALAAFVVGVAAPVGSRAGSPAETPPERPGTTRPELLLRADYLHRLGRGVGGGARFAADRTGAEFGATKRFGDSVTVGASISYGLDAYAFGGDGAFGGGRAWGEIHRFGLTVPVRLEMGDRWRLFAGGTVRVTAEDAAAWGDAVTGGGFLGCSYRFGEALTLGPGVGVLTQIADDPQVFPVLLVEWRIAPRLKLATGGVGGTTVGPGLQLAWDFAERWRLAVGGRYERLRFRMAGGEDGKGGRVAAIGEDRGWPVYARLDWRLQPQASLQLTAGFEVGGEVRLADGGGRTVAAARYGTAPFVGLGFEGRF